MDQTISQPAKGALLLVPLGVEPPIFPWGVTLIADHVRAARADKQVEVVDLARHPRIRALVDGNKEFFRELRVKLSAAGAKTFPSGGPARSGYNDTFVGVLLCLGGRYIDVAREHDMYPSIRSAAWFAAKRARLDELRDEHERVLAEIFAEVGLDRTLVGITTYDHTVYYVLALARRIKALSETARVIVGGDFWDFRTAREAVNKLAWLDGVCVGYGENVIVELLDAMDRGEGFDDMLMKGFINRALIAKEDQSTELFVKPKHLELDDGEPRTYQTMNVPQAYLDGAAANYTLVHDHPEDPSGRDNPSQTTFLRVLTKRGCSYSACRFCTQIDRFLNFPISIEDTIKQIEARFERVDPANPVNLFIDNDELDVDELTRMIQFLEQHPSKWGRVLFWFQVKRFKPEIAAAVAASHDPKKYFFVMNWESLNPLTLQHMGKGHSVLDGIESAKAILDAGGDWMSNLMGAFPAQTFASIAEETKYIHAARHLIADSTVFCFFSYCANSRDQITGNAPRYHMHTVQDKNIWPQVGFDVELSLSLFEWQWQDSREGPEGVLARTWHELIQGKRSLWNATPRLVYHSIRAGDYAYVKRLRAFGLTKRDGDLVIGRGRPAKVVLDGRTLRIRSGGWLTRERRITVSEVELALLREAYFVRKIADVRAAMVADERLSEAEFDALVERHVELGSIATHKDKMISLARDPEYLKLRQRVAKPEAARAEEPGLVRLRLANAR